MVRASWGPYRTPVAENDLPTGGVRWQLADWIVLVVMWLGSVARLDVAIRSGELLRLEATFAAAVMVLGPALIWRDQRKRRSGKPV